MDEGTAGKLFCPWCENEKISSGFSMCFSNFCICKKCLIELDKEQAKENEENDKCFKCNEEKELHYTKSKTIGICNACIKWGIEILKLNINTMNFFETLQQQDAVDISIRIMKKNERLTINVMPGSGNSVTKPIIITGTGAELDEAFFTTVLPGVKEVGGIISNLEEVKKEAEEKSKPAAKETKAADKKPAAKKTETKVEEPTMFD